MDHPAQHSPSKVRYVFHDGDYSPKPGEKQAARDIGKALDSLTQTSGQPAEQVVGSFHVQSRIEKHKGRQPNFNRPKVAPAKAASVKVGPGKK